MRAFCGRLVVFVVGEMDPPSWNLDWQDERMFQILARMRACRFGVSRLQGGLEDDVASR